MVRLFEFPNLAGERRPRVEPGQLEIRGREAESTRPRQPFRTDLTVRRKRIATHYLCREYHKKLP